VQCLLFALPDLQPEAERRREVTNKVECPACGKEITLRKNGRFWQHNNGKPQYPGSIWMENCEMSGRIDTRNRD
jgi:ribosomal protein L37AE/L43A